MINKFRVFNFFSEYIKDDMNNFYVKVIAGCLVFVALILAAGFFTLVYQMRKTENAKKDDWDKKWKKHFICFLLIFSVYVFYILCDLYYLLIFFHNFNKPLIVIFIMIFFQNFFYRNIDSVYKPWNVKRFVVYLKSLSL